MTVLELQFECGEESLSVRRFVVSEGISRPFEVAVWARSPDDGIDLEAIVGKTASLRVVHGIAHALELSARAWAGVCSLAQQVQAEPTGLSTYHLRIVPTAWLLDQRRNHRIFQHLTIPQIAGKILDEWGVAHVLRLTAGDYPTLEYRVQYGESDFAFVQRMLEEAGIAYYFEDGTGKMVLRDQPQHNDPRPGPPIHHVDNPSQSAEREFVTHVRLSHEVRPGRVKIRDHDFRRRTDYALFGDASPAAAPEHRYEQFVYLPGSFVADGGRAGDTPTADDHSVARADDKAGQGRADRTLESLRTSKRHVAFQTNVLDLAPGVIFSMARHPRADLAERLLVTDLSIDGAVGEEWHTEGSAVFAAQPYRPPLRTPKPHLFSVQSAVVVGPPGQEIYTDEFGRVRVQFHWDRYGKYDDHSSSWLRVSQGWAGSGFGMIAIPRVGQEVLVGFLEGNPDQPIVVGRVFNSTTTIPYKLPDHKTVTSWKSDSSPGHGGFNEIKFEDAAGTELVYVQAQRDLEKLVKRNETEVTGVDRTETIGHDLRKQVGNDEIETTAVNRIIMVGVNHNTTVGVNRSAQVGVIDSTIVGALHTLSMAPPSQTGVTMIDKKITLTTGEATITLEGPDVRIEANGNISLQAKGDVSVEAKGKVTVRSTADDVIVHGAPNVKIN